MSNITIEQLAQMNQKEFLSIHGEIKDLHTEMKQLTKVVLDIKGTIENDTAQLKHRVTRVEDTIGIGEQT